MGRCFLVACCSFIRDPYLAWLLSTTVCHIMWLTDIPCRLFEPSSRRASVSSVSLVTHAGISSLMVVVRVVDSHAFFKSWTRVHRYWLQCRNEKNDRRQNRTDGQKVWACSMRAGGGTARVHGERGVGPAPGLGPLCSTSNC